MLNKLLDTHNIVTKVISKHLYVLLINLNSLSNN